MIVLDASVWVSCLVPSDAHHTVSRAWLETYLAGGGEMIAPNLLLAETAGAIARRTGSATAAHHALEATRHLPNLRVIEIDLTLGDRAAQLAADLSLRGADALYAALAQQLAAPLVTWDTELQTRTVGMIIAQQPTA
jgi:predicted nucleic acid-binding protein